MLSTARQLGVVTKDSLCHYVAGFPSQCVSPKQEICLTVISRYIALVEI